ncbi:MAG: hypothetical protein AB1679_23260 [Actinomycetota bacterium]
MDPLPDMAPVLAHAGEEFAIVFLPAVVLLTVIWLNGRRKARSNTADGDPPPGV